MNYQLSIIEKSSYLHIIVTGQLTRNNVERYFEEIRHYCLEHRISRILIEENLEGPRLNVMDILQLISHESIKSMRLFTAIAYVDVKAEGNSMNFIEDAAVNRALPVTVFPTVDAAEKWLLSLSS
jgi:hypothetical protein